MKFRKKLRKVRKIMSKKHKRISNYLIVQEALKEFMLGKQLIANV